MSSTTCVTGRKEEVQDDMSTYQCAICNEYLRTSEAEGGKCICTNCTSKKPDVVKIWRTTFQQISFPCRNEEYGCKEKLLFGHIAKHEEDCQFKPASCCLTPFGSCTWKGYAKDVMKHFSEEHPQNVLKDGELLVSLEHELKEKLVVSEQNGNTIILYYNLDKLQMKLYYCIRYFLAHESKITSNIKISDALNTENQISLQQTSHKPYLNESSFNDKSILDLNYILPALGNTNSILISVNTNASLQLNKLAQLKCTFCDVYVKPPIFKTAAGKLSCNICAEKNHLKSVKDESLENTMSQLNYPCRWEFCNVVGGCKNVKKHEDILCSHRKIICPVPSCYKTFTLEQVRSHFLTNHENIKYKDTISFTEKLNIQVGYHNQFYLIKGDKVLLINVSIYSTGITNYLVYPCSATQLISAKLQPDCCRGISVQLNPFDNTFLDETFICCMNKTGNGDFFLIFNSVEDKS